MAAARRGCVVLSSHLGSFEATRVVSFEDPSVVVHVVVDRALNPNFTRNLEAIAPGMAQLVVDASLPPAAVVLRVAELLRDGHWVGVPADRRMPGTPGVDVEFLGRPCRLPRGPFALAAMFDVPVIMATGLYLDGAYELRFDRLQPVRTQARAERDAAVRELARQYAARLERYAVMAPGNWFNFFRFWEQRP
jgi:predicted LPLAT superfamily acyltransferase